MRSQQELGVTADLKVYKPKTQNRAEENEELLSFIEGNDFTVLFPSLKHKKANYKPKRCMFQILAIFTSTSDVTRYYQIIKLTN